MGIVEGVRRACGSGAPRALLILVALGLPAACSSGASAGNTAGKTAGDRGDDPVAVVSSLGAVPVPSAVPAESTPSARPGHPALLAMGGPVDLSLPDGTRALVTALGPEQQVQMPAGTTVPLPTNTPATVTLRLVVSRGSLTATAGELSSRDETGAQIRLTPMGPASVRAVPGHPAEVRVSGVYSSGSAQLTWRHDGHVLAVWTFTIELD